MNYIGYPIRWVTYIQMKNKLMSKLEVSWVTFSGNHLEHRIRTRKK